MNARAHEALVDVWRCLARNGKKVPTNAQVFTIVRELGHAFIDKEGKTLLMSFRANEGRRPVAALAPQGRVGVIPGASPLDRARGAGATHAGVVLYLDVDTVETTVLTLPTVATEPTSRENAETTVDEKTTKVPKSREQWVPKAVPVDLPTRLPDAILELKHVAVVFLAEFANVTSLDAKRKNGGDYTAALAIARSRGVSTAQIWQAFCDARVAKDGVPIFGAQAKSAIAFLGERLRVVPSAPARRYPGFVVISFEDNTYWRYDGPDRPVGWADTLPRGGTILPKPVAIVDGAAVAR